VRPGSEEYLDSEKYQIRPRDWSQATLNELIARVNEIRRQHPALQYNDGLAFHETDNPAFLWFSKRTPGPRTRPTSDFAASLSGTRSAHDEHVFVVANTDARWTQHGWVRMPMHHLALSPHAAYVVEDLLDGTCYTWRGEWNYVRLDPSERVAHIFVVRS
jgi:starch synthase (maltosyl-transferring)